MSVNRQLARVTTIAAVSLAAAAPGSALVGSASARITRITRITRVRHVVRGQPVTSVKTHLSTRKGG